MLFDLCRSADETLVTSTLVSSQGDFGCSAEAVQIAAMLQLENVFITPYKKKKAAVSFISIFEYARHTSLSI